MIRTVDENDAEPIASIYAHHVLHGTASYDVEPPSVADTLEKVRRIAKSGWPFLVAEQNGEVVGYAYATQFRDRDAYRFTCENSIYVHADWTGQGIGKALLKHLCEGCEKFGFRQVIAVIGGAELPASRFTMLAVSPRSAASAPLAGKKSVGWTRCTCNANWSRSVESSNLRPQVLHSCPGRPMRRSLLVANRRFQGALRPFTSVVCCS